MRDEIARARALKATNMAMAYKEGHHFGECWARDRATPQELRTLQTFFLELSSSGLETVFTHGTGAQILRAKMLDPYGTWSDSDLQQCAAFWEKVLDGKPERMNDGEFARGFAEGAIELWEEIDRD